MKTTLAQRLIFTLSRYAWLLALVLSLSHERVSVAQFILGDPISLGAPIETSENELAPELSADGLTLYFQKGNYNDFADLYWATRDSLDSPWNDPLPIASINTDRHEASPAVSPDGWELYFDDGHRSGYPSLARPGGLGGPDIWISRWDPENNYWGEPANLGAPINSSSRDYGPNLSADGLELYFSSDRPGGHGSTDIWVAQRPTLDDPWNQPVNLGFNVNGGSHDERPAISPDGRTLIFGSTRAGGMGGPSSMWISTRERIGDDWRTPIVFSNKVNGPYWSFDPEFSPDGATLYYGRFDTGPRNTVWQISLGPLEAVSLSGGEYVQIFDEMLSQDGMLGHTLPPGWAITTDGYFFENITTHGFPFPAEEIIPRNAMSIFNTGGVQSTDRSLGIGVFPSSDNTTIQLLTQSEAFDALSFQLQFDVEVWRAERSEGTGRQDIPEKVAFCISVEIDSGEGFTLLRGLGTVTAGSVTPPPSGDTLDGNAEANRVSFNSGVLPTWIPAGSELRVRWKANPDNTQSKSWVYGLDNVVLSLFDTDAIELGDFNEDGVLDIADLNALAAQFAAPTHDTLYDLDGNGRVDVGDIAIWNALASPQACVK